MTLTGRLGLGVADDADLVEPELSKPRRSRAVARRPSVMFVLVDGTFGDRLADDDDE